MSSGSVHGVLPVDKPRGPTSHDVVAVARRALGVRRIGHTGTLDPFASGLLLLCVGEATRLAEFLTGMDKTYEATLRLGVATTSGDLDGEAISISEAWRDLAPGTLASALQAFRGSLEQVPPSLSAKKVGGVPAHRRVRRGEEVVLTPQAVTVHELDLLGFEPPEVRLRIRCSSGTYVRSLARDLGNALLVGAHLTELRRTAIGRFGLDEALSLDDLGVEARVAGAIISPLGAVESLARVLVDAASAADLGHGRAVDVGDLPDVGVAVAACGATLVAIGHVRGGRFLPRKVLAHG